MKIIDGKLLANSLNQELRKKILFFKDKYGKTPYLVVILVGNNQASEVYVNNKKKKAIEIGIKSKVIRLSDKITEDNLLKTIDSCNSDNSIDSILVQLPLPNHINSNKVIDRISIEKDVDGFNSKNIGLLAMGRPKVVPCTPLGCYKMLESILNLESKNVLILGRSNIVGKPLSYLLTNKNATVTLAHSKTNNLKSLSLRSDIIIAAIGKANFLKKDWVKKNAVIIDVGINVVVNEKGLRKIVGDVDYKDVYKKVSFISPVPGGVGPMTIHCLLSNTLSLAQKRKTS
ncbi:MAG: bifunctional methylenetetrahydrofolate dehydrogenase/methenyltetrahydrofolate cyclohydrolase [Pelagibacterales bacterium]|nr:bifunctional methylenetetrahydrofolate dehydrogenase/methenyltetrahydrofolate cyclohydrolase [Pelagibacterales bacterium]OUU63333.1 MAG: bifunctional methylenetetrahydrofolate dehydrogenase/methenyltetrahydrofolate cyclohydrolase [Alphaproteobacteria bacterium TMED62]|tara:strand:+ start:421 stop:1281 length:861 start_codon:yes stop_codon:yes gene_type:complete